MKVTVLGAGEQGHVLTYWMARHPQVTEVIVADWNKERADEVAARVGANKAKAAQADARDVEQTAALAEGSRLIINAVMPEWCHYVMQAALKTKAHYQDMSTGISGALVDEVAKQLALDEPFREIGRTALLGTGIAPGVSSTCAAIAYEDLDRCTEIHIRACFIVHSTVPLQTWSQHTYYHDCNVPALYWEDGKHKWAEPFGGWEIYDFPPPLGPLAVAYHDHDECATLPQFLPKLGEKGLRYVDFKFGSEEDFVKGVKAIVETGMATEKPVVINGVEVVPLDVLAAVLPANPPRDEIARLAEAGDITDVGATVIEAYRESGQPPAETFVIIPPDIQQATKIVRGATAISYYVSTAAAVYSEYLLDGKITQTGAFPTEALDRQVRVDYLKELQRRGFSISRRTESPF